MIPTRKECFLILQKYNFPQRKMRHAELVERVALFLVRELKKHGFVINEELVRAGALLHDIDKGMWGAGKVHPKKGVEILQKLGYPEVARICETHTIDAFLDPLRRPRTWEEKVVALADKMVKDKIITVDARYKLWREEDLAEEAQEELRKSYPLLKELEKEILGIIGIKPEEIKFLISN